MKKVKLFLLSILSVWLLSGCGEEPSNVEPHELIEVVMAGDYARIYNQFSEELKSIVSLKEFEEIMKSSIEAQQSFELEAETHLNDTARYVWVDQGTNVGLTATWDTQGTVIGFQILQLSSYPETDQNYTTNHFRLPLRGEWLVVWGGTNVLTNYHYDHAPQRYAIDVIRVKEGRSYEGDPSQNESYHAFNQEVIAPADGIVVSVVNNIEDNVPVGKLNEHDPFGNYIMIDHGEEEYSTIAHLKNNSILVKEGDTVQKGDLLGLVGNSGRSSEPHIHFQVSIGSNKMTDLSKRIQFDSDIRVVQGEVITGE